MGVAARFYVSEVTRQAYDPSAVKVKLTAVSRGDQNASWSKATPSGTIEMQVQNPSAGKWFEDMLGKDVAISFTPVETAAPADGHTFRPSEVNEGQSWPTEKQCGECGSVEEAHTG